MFNSCNRRQVLLGLSLVCALNLFLFTAYSNMGAWAPYLPFRLLAQGNNTFTADNINNVNLTSTAAPPPITAAANASAMMTPPAGAVINPHNFSYVHLPDKANTCSDHTRFVMAVPISRNNFPGRDAVRETWGSYAYNATNQAVLLFFLGSADKGEQADIQERIDKEFSDKGDIVQESFVDSYRNLSLKSVAILKYAVSFCGNAEFLVKADDDMYVNVPLLRQRLAETVLKKNSQNFILGRLVRGARPMHNTNSKWYVSLQEYKEKFYPDYASGTAYATTLPAARMLYQASLRLPNFYLEDVFITGMCRRQAGLEMVAEPTMTYDKPQGTGCTFRTRISGHRYSRDQIRLIHQQLYDRNATCSP